jgi:glutamate racemase
MSIGIFDSGFGGLTVLRAIRQLLPHENSIYFGDTARLPYGNKSAETILRYSLENTSFLLERGIKVLVIACHTACAIALEQIRATISIPVIGIIDTGVAELSRLTPGNKLAILGTKATIASGVYQHKIQQLLPQATLTAIACPFFVPLVEEGYLKHPLATLAAQEYLHPLKDKQIHAILLGCTHYPLLQPIIQKELGEQVLVINPAEACAKQVQKILMENHLENPQKHPPHHQFFVSDDPEKFRLLGTTFLNYPIDNVLHC